MGDLLSQTLEMWLRISHELYPKRALPSSGTDPYRAKLQPNVVCAVAETRKHMVVGCHGENCLPYCLGSEQLGASLRATCCSRKSVLVIPFIWVGAAWTSEGKKKKTVITTTTIIKNICSACTVCQGPFILRAFDHSRSQIFTALHRCCYYSYFKRSKLKLGVSVTCQR